MPSLVKRYPRTMLVKSVGSMSIDSAAVVVLFKTSILRFQEDHSNAQDGDAAAHAAPHSRSSGERAYYVCVLLAGPSIPITLIFGNHLRKSHGVEAQVRQTRAGNLSRLAPESILSTEDERIEAQRDTQPKLETMSPETRRYKQCLFHSPPGYQQYPLMTQKAEHGQN